MKKVKIALCIPTYNHPALMEEFLYQHIAYYGEKGLDVYVYDSSPGNETEVLVSDFSKKADFVHYIRLPEEMSAGEKVYLIFQQYGMEKEYDFIWICGDGVRYLLQVMDNLLPYVSLEYDMIHFNGMDKEGIGDRIYQDCNAYFLDCAWQATLLGSVLVNCHTMLKDVDWDKYKHRFLRDGYYDYTHISFYFNRMVELPGIRIRHVSLKSGICNSSRLKKQSSWYARTFDVLCVGWINTIEALPSCYTNKDLVIRKLGKYSELGNEMAFLQKRIDGVYSEEVLKKYENEIPRFSDLKTERLKQIACMTTTEACRELEELMERWKRVEGLVEWRRFLNDYPGVFIFGEGLQAKKYAKFLADEEINCGGFCVSEKTGSQDSIMGYPVYEIEELTEEQKQYGFYLALSPLNRRQVMLLLEGKGLAEQAFFSEKLDGYISQIYAQDDE